MRAEQRGPRTEQVVGSSPTWLSCIFVLLKKFFLVNWPAKLLGVYMIRVNLDVLQWKFP